MKIGIGCSRVVASASLLVAMAAGADTVAIIGEDSYETLAAAVASAESGDVISLAADVVEDLTISHEADVTLDLAGFTLKNIAGDVISNYGKLKIVSTSEGGSIESELDAKAAIVNFPGGVLELAGGTVKVPDTSTYYNIKNMGQMKITGETAVISRASTKSTLVANGWYGSKGTDRGTTGVADTAILIIEGGSFEGGMNVVKNDDYGMLYITGGTFRNLSLTDAVILNWNEAEISGGSFEGETKVLANGSYGAESADKGRLTVTGGSFTANTGTLFGEGKGGSAMADAIVAITGGTFSGEVAGIAQGKVSISSTAESSPSFDSAIPLEYLADETHLTYDSETKKYLPAAGQASGYVELEGGERSYFASIGEIGSANGKKLILLADLVENIELAAPGEKVTVEPGEFNFTGNVLATFAGGEVQTQVESGESSALVYTAFSRPEVEISSISKTADGAGQMVTVQVKLGALLAGTEYALKIAANGISIDEAVEFPEGLAEALTAGTADGEWNLTWTPAGDLSPEEFIIGVWLESSRTGVVTPVANPETEKASVTIDTRPRWTVCFSNEASGVDANGMVDSQVFTNHVAGVLTQCLYSRTGYGFANWTNETGAAYADMAEFAADGDTALTADLALYSAWTATTYRITYTLADTEAAIAQVRFAKENPETYTIEDEVSLENPRRPGYEFTGWTGTGLEGATMAVSFSGETGARFYVATWSAIETSADNPLVISDVGELNGNEDLPQDSYIRLELEDDVDETIVVPSTVAALTINGNGRTITGSPGRAAIVVANDASRLSLTMEGAFTLQEYVTPQLVGAGPLLGAGGIKFASAGANGVAGSDAVRIRDIVAGDGEWKVAFEVVLKPDQDFEAWLARANLAGLIKLRIADALADIYTDHSQVVDATVAGVEVAAGEGENVVVFTVRAPQDAASHFFAVEIQ